MSASFRPPDSDPDVTAWRLAKVEEQIAELIKALQSSTSVLGAQITALSNQIGTGLASLPEHYAPRREAEERHRAVNDQFFDLDRRLNERKDGTDRRMEQLEKSLDQRIASNSRSIDALRGWLVGAIIGALGAAATALLDLLKPK